MLQLTRSWGNLSLLDKQCQDFILAEDHRKGEFEPISIFIILFEVLANLLGAWRVRLLWLRDKEGVRYGGWPKSRQLNLEYLAIFNVPNSSRLVEEKIPLSAINMGINFKDAAFDTKIFGPATTSRVSELMQKTLADPNNANHESNPTINEPLIQAID
ncbi:hypothetical protein CMV_008960 [Castanea mollissima]|uniref:Uncharacterized protein n=1 Tax=Castanea mollissima TaxID=60419 RepID=A0A8J4RKZ6_9ROSI|nr:hypothetical protein CMV_008960 [Castanea mollissima]